MPEDEKTLDDKKPTDDKPADASGEPKKPDDSGAFVHPETGEKYVPIGISRKWEGRAKENYEAKQELDALKESKKSDNQKLTDKATASDKAAATAQGELLRLRVAMRKGLTEAQAKRLIGATEEDLEADADELLASFTTKDASGGDKSPTRPKEKLRSGSTNAEELSSDPQQRARDYYATAPSKPTRK